MTKGNPSVQHTPKAKVRFDFLWVLQMHSICFSSTSAFSFLRVNCCDILIALSVIARLSVYHFERPIIIFVGRENRSPLSWKRAEVAYDADCC
ncbi:MAG TPA: hypothetical protein VI756_06470, partial [Blastocatellia bacterium]